MLSMIKQLLQPHYCHWHCFYWAAWQIHTHTHIKGACDTAVESGRCMLSRPAECLCWAPAGIKASSRPIQISVCPLLASSCIHTQWVTGQHDAQMLAKVTRSACLRLETWLAYTTHDHSSELLWKLVRCWSEITSNGMQVIERGLVTLDSLLAGAYFTTRQNRLNLTNGSSVSAVSKPTAIWLTSHIRESCYRELSVLTFGLYRLLESQDNVEQLIRPHVLPTSSQRSSIVEGL